MALAYKNPNYYRSLQRSTRSADSQQKAHQRAQLRFKYRKAHGNDWWRNPSVKAQYESEASSRGISAKDLIEHVMSGNARQTPTGVKNERAKLRRRLARQGGWDDIVSGRKGKPTKVPYSRTRAMAYKMGKKRMYNSRGQMVVDVDAVQAYNAQRQQMRATHGQRWRTKLIQGIRDDSHSPLLPDKAWVGKGPFKKRRKGSKGGGMNAGFRRYLDLTKQAKGMGINTKGMKLPQLEAAVSGARMNPFGGLALENPVPFVGGVVGSVAPKLVSGLAGAAVHAVLPQVSNIPVVGEYFETGLDKIQSVSIPEVVPVIGGMGVGNTLVGAIGGLGLIALSQYAGRKFRIPAIAKYGAIAGAGAMIVGPAMDYFGGASGGIPELDELDELEDLGALGVESLGGLALENTNTLGDGMAYELAGVADGEYGQASLADAYYSGADFDIGEGRALLNGRGQWRKRFGKPAHRLSRKAGGPSHLAGKPGHRWGWLIKMIGFEKTRQVASLEPEDRLSVLKAMRSAALTSLDNATPAQAEAAEGIAGTGAYGAQAADGAQGAYGSTIFGGGGM